MSFSSTGWCAGDGSNMPVAGAFQPSEREYGPFMTEFERNVRAICDRFISDPRVDPPAPPPHFVIEGPLLMRWDNLDRLLRLYGPWMLLQKIAHDRGIAVHIATPMEVKKELAGRRGAAGGVPDKDDMIRCALKLGVELPATKASGRDDAADAVALWKLGVRLFARQHLEVWDRRLYSNRADVLL